MAETNDAPQYFVQHGAGESIFREGEPGAEMYIIQDGQVEILKSLGGRDQRVAVLEEGDFFGEIAILEDVPRSASARALTDCVLLRMNRAAFDQMARHNPEIPVRMLRKLCRRLREADPLLLDVDPGPVIELKGATPQPRPSAPPPLPSQPPGGTHAKFVHDSSGTEFFLATGPETLVGRYDASTGISPDIDLKQVDTQHSISRRHAKVLRRGAGFFVRDEVGSTNGTFVNRERIPTGADVEIKDNDRVQFGLVSTVFRTT